MKSIDGIATKFIGGVLGIAALTTIFGRSNTPRVLDAFGRLFTGSLNAALGADAGLR